MLINFRTCYIQPCNQQLGNSWKWNSLRGSVVGVCNCSMFCCMLLYAHSSIAIILLGKRELVALLNLSSWCLVMVERLFLVVPRGCLRFVIVVFPDHTHLLILFDRKNIDNHYHWGLYILCLPPYISNYWLEIKSLVQRSSNLLDSTV